MSEEPAIREPISNAEFCRFVQEAQDQRARAAAAEAQVAQLRAALEWYADERQYECRPIAEGIGGLPLIDQDAGDRARAALVPGKPSAEPGVLRSAACAQHGARLCATCAGFEGESPYAEPGTEES